MISARERARRAKVALITSVRCARHGPPDRYDATTWWQQVQDIAGELGRHITWDEVQHHPDDDP